MNRLFCFACFLVCLPLCGFGQADTVPPQLVCKNLTVNSSPTGLVTIFDSMLVLSVVDNGTPTNAIDLGIRKPCVGDGFPENQHSLWLTCDFFTNKVEVWARDAAGNTSLCRPTVTVQDVLGNCDPSPTYLYILTSTQQVINKVSIKILSTNCLPDTLQTEQSDFQGPWLQWGNLPVGYHTTITPTKSINPLNGVTQNDLLLIAKHFLNIQPLTNPYQLIAADANQDGHIDAQDIITIRKIILHLAPNFPNNRSWRFVPKDYAFSNPQNPFSPAFPERIEVPSTADPAPNYFEFIGVKLGDVDFSADPGQ